MWNVKNDMLCPISIFSRRGTCIISQKSSLENVMESEEKTIEAKNTLSYSDTIPGFDQ